MKNSSTILKFILILFAAILSCPELEAQTWAWTEQTVDKQPGRFTSLATDKEGNVHMVYSSDAEGFKYAFHSVADPRWYTMQLEGGAGYTGIAIDAQGNPHACLAVNSTGTIQYAFFTGGKWNLQQIAPGTGPVWYSCSIGIAADGTPHVTWYQEKGPDLSLYGHYKYAVLRDGAWLARTIDMDPLTGKWHSMVVDAKGSAHISYDCFVNGELKYAVETGPQWQIGIADSRRLSHTGRLESAPESVGMGNSLALDDSGAAHISYQTDTSIKYASQSGETFKTQVVDSVRAFGSWVGYRTTLVLDKRGMPHIAYEHSGALKHAYWDGRRWNVQLLVHGGQEPYRFSSMAIDKNDVIYISYRDPEDGSVKVRVGKPAQQEPGPAKTQTAVAPTKVDDGKAASIAEKPKENE